MKIKLKTLTVETKQEEIRIDLGYDVFFIHGSVGQGKSTALRLIDFCLGGDLVSTPALREEFLGAKLLVSLGENETLLHRMSSPANVVRVAWKDADDQAHALNVPIQAGDAPVLSDEVYNLSDLVLHLCGLSPLKVRRSKVDPDSNLIRLSLRDILTYCVLEQNELDSSFYAMDHPFKCYKSRDVMRFVTGLYSQRLSEVEQQLQALQKERTGANEAALQLKQFIEQFELGTEEELFDERAVAEGQLAELKQQRAKLQQERNISLSPLDEMRHELGKLSRQVVVIDDSIEDLQRRIEEQTALRAELIATKIKANRASLADAVLGKVEFEFCPRCYTSISQRRLDDPRLCCLCAQVPSAAQADKIDFSEIDSRIDELADSVARHGQELEEARSSRKRTIANRNSLDARLNEEMESINSLLQIALRDVDRKIAALEERLAFLERLKQLPAALSQLKTKAIAAEAMIAEIRDLIEKERSKLVEADKNIAAISAAFLHTIQAVKFPGVYEGDSVHLDPRYWKPVVKHGTVEWTYDDAGSGGKRTLFNVCFALALHRVARDRGLPLPTLLMIDSPTKNITDDEDPELVEALYAEIYRLAGDFKGEIQIMLVDSKFYPPSNPKFTFSDRHMPPPLIPYYSGP